MQDKDKKIGTHALAACCTLAAIVSLGGCGDNIPDSGASSSDKTGSVSGEFQGAGASSQQAAVETWIAMYQRKNHNVKIAYNPTGSGAGVSTFLTGATAWAGSDTPLEDSSIEQSKQVCAGKTAFEVPVYVSGIVVVFNLKGISGLDKHLNMDSQTIAKIFDGKITRWNDPVIKGQNPKVDLPSTPITVVHRTDKSGTTENFLSYLKDNADQDWPYTLDQNWPNDVGQGSKGGDGVFNTVSQADGTIGYVDASKAGTLGTISIKVGQSYVPYSSDAASTAVDSSKVNKKLWGDGRLVIDIDHRTQAAKAYPMLLISYDVVCPVYKEISTAKFVKSWLTYEVSQEGQKAIADNTGAVPLGDQMRSKIMKRINGIDTKAPPRSK